MSSSEKTSPEPAFSSNDVRLSPRQWLVAAVILAAFSFTPSLWERFETLDPGPNDRIPYSLGNDYWTFGRYCRAACARQETLVIGDSVVWGHYVGKDETLSAQLNKLTGSTRFANLGVDGVHPAALLGLIEYYGRDIAGRDVILHCNLLWMSSKRHDLQVQKEFSFNHPALVPQFFPRIPCYREPLSGRLGIAMGRQVPFLAWARHLQVAYFGGADYPTWLLDHPYANPLGVLLRRPPSPEDLPSPPPVAEPWSKSQLAKFNAAWVELDTSFQWQCFRRTIDVLRARGNRVLVVVGPFNEHMLTEKSLHAYHQRVERVNAWLTAARVRHYVARVLPTDDYADASHPLASGYALLARQLPQDVLGDSAPPP